MADLKAGDNGYPVTMRKQKYLDHIWKSSAATQFHDRPRVNNFSTTNNQQVELQNKQHHLQDQQSSITANQNKVTDRITKPCEEDNESRIYKENLLG